MQNPLQASRTVRIIEAERQLLASLCQHVLESGIYDSIVQRLTTHTFLDPEHEIIFLALTKLPRGNSQDRRAALGAVLTRLGFPDYDLEPFFSAPVIPAEQLQSVLQAL